MINLKKVGSAAAVTVAMTGALLAGTSTAAQAATVHGCPSGYACIYPQDAGWNNDKPSLKYYHYGTYQLSNQFGNHYIMNNQTGGAPIWGCTDWNGNTCPWYVGAGSWAVANLTPINSVKLVPSL
jgi:hypothetical protein